MPNPTLYFTSNEKNALSRSKYIRAALRRNGYQVIRAFPPSENHHSIWFCGINSLYTQIDESLLDKIRAFKGKLVLHQNDPGGEFNLVGIPDDILNQAVLLLKRQWHIHFGNLPADLKSKAGFINPPLKPNLNYPGKLIRDRKLELFFFGSQNGGKNLPDGLNCRTECVRKIKQSGLPFIGGLFDSAQVAPEDVKAERITQKEHDYLMKESKICLALWGASPITYRFFEGLGMRSLVVMPDWTHIRTIDENNFGLTSGDHYIGVKHDLSDFIPTLEYFLSHPEEAQKIADNGYRFFVENIYFKGVNLTQPIFEAVISSWKGLVTAAPQNFRYRLQSMIMSQLRSA